MGVCKKIYFKTSAFLMRFTVGLRDCQTQRPVGVVSVHLQRSSAEGQGQLTSCRAASQEERQATPNVLLIR